MWADLSPEDRRIADAANRALAFEGPLRTRVEEVMAFARTLGAHTVGVAFCSSLSFEARIFCSVLRDNGFAVESVICKNGSHAPDDLGIASPKPAGEDCVVCNPIVQAELLNEAKTGLNVIMGLCPGHDSLFIRHSEAPVTVMAVRDFAAGHNPLAPLYQHEAHFRRIHDASLPPELTA